MVTMDTTVHENSFLIRTYTDETYWKQLKDQGILLLRSLDYYKSMEKGGVSKTKDSEEGAWGYYSEHIGEPIKLFISPLDGSETIWLDAHSIRQDIKEWAYVSCWGLLENPKDLKVACEDWVRANSKTTPTYYVVYPYSYLVSVFSSTNSHIRPTRHGKVQYLTGNLTERSVQYSPHEGDLYIPAFVKSVDYALQREYRFLYDLRNYRRKSSNLTLYEELSSNPELKLYLIQQELKPILADKVTLQL